MLVIIIELRVWNRVGILRNHVTVHRMAKSNQSIEEGRPEEHS